MLSRKGIPQGEWRLHPESIRMIWTLYGRVEVDLFAMSEKAHCPLFFSLSHSPLEGDVLTSRWPAARLYVFPPIKILPLVLRKLKEERASLILITPNLPNQPWFPDLIELLVAPPWPIPSGRICYPRWTARCGTRTRSCGAFICGCFGDIRGAERPAFSSARYASGGASTLYEMSVCFKMGSDYEMVWSGSNRPGYLHRVGCSEFSTVQAG